MLGEQVSAASDPLRAARPSYWWSPVAAMRTRWLLLAVSAVALLWRLPSLFDPPMVQDEGTYFAVAQAMAHHYRLYADVWENKPPALYLLYGAVYHQFGPSLLVIRIITSLTALALVILVFRLARLYGSEYVALAAAMLAGLLLGVPFLEGTTGNAEIFLSLFAALSVYLALRQAPGAVAGISMAAALLFKAVAFFDASALALYLVRAQRRVVLPYLAGLLGVLGAVAAIAWWFGVLPAMFLDAFVYDLGYVGYANGGAVPWVVFAKVACVVGMTFALRRAPFPYLWLVYAVIGALFSGRSNGHYAIQVVAPLSVSLAVLFHNREVLARRALVAFPSAALCGVTLVSCLGWGLVLTGHNSFAAQRMQWYLNFARFALQQESYATYRGQIDDHVNRNLRIVAAVDSLPPGKILVWGNAPWLYVLSGRLPATPYTTALWQPEVPGESAALRRALASGMPAGLVILSQPSPPFGSAATMLDQLYRPVSTIGDARVYASIR